jgi:hypothetical protein
VRVIYKKYGILIHDVFYMFWTLSSTNKIAYSDTCKSHDTFIHNRLSEYEPSGSKYSEDFINQNISLEKLHFVG